MNASNQPSREAGPWKAILVVWLALGLLWPLAAGDVKLYGVIAAPYLTVVAFSLVPPRVWVHYWPTLAVIRFRILALVATAAIGLPLVGYVMADNGLI